MVPVEHMVVQPFVIIRVRITGDSREKGSTDASTTMSVAHKEVFHQKDLSCPRRVAVEQGAVAEQVAGLN